VRREGKRGKRGEWRGGEGERGEWEIEREMEMECEIESGCLKERETKKCVRET